MVDRDETPAQFVARMRPRILRGRAQARVSRVIFPTLMLILALYRFFEGHAWLHFLYLGLAAFNLVLFTLLVMLNDDTLRKLDDIERMIGS